MNEKDFEFLSEQASVALSELKSKINEYSPNDPLLNFRVAAQALDVGVDMVLWTRLVDKAVRAYRCKDRVHALYDVMGYCLLLLYYQLRDRGRKEDLCMR